MPTLAAGQSTSFSISPGISATFTSSFGTNFRYSFVPVNAALITSQSDARSFGPAAQNLSIGPFAVHGTVNVTNDSGSLLTYGSLVSTGTEVGSLTINGPTSMTGAANVTFSPANSNVTISPTGTGVVTIAPGSTGTMNNMTIGSATRQTGAFTILTVSKGDSSGTPGNVTQNAAAGRVAIAAGANNVVVTNNVVGTLSTVFAVISQAAADATLTQIVRVVPAAGSFTIYGNANATANTVVDYLVFGN